MFVRNRVVNPVMGWLLRSPLHRMVSGRVALITVTGRRTGRVYRFPVMYARAGDRIYVLVGQHTRKTWWRNVRRPAPVRVLVAGRRLDGTAEVLEGAEAEAAKEAYLARFPKAARAVDRDTPVVRITPRPEPSADAPPQHRVLVSRYGGPEVLRLVEEPVPEPGPGEARVKISAAGVSFTDVLIREGVYPGGPRPPFTPGYDLVGVVDAVGPGTTGAAPGDRVSALVEYGGYAQYLCVPATRLLPVPDGVDAAGAVCLPLTYVTAYQLLHRAAHVQQGERVLVHGAAGAVGSAVLQLGRLAGLEMYGTATAEQADLVTKLGATPIDHVSEDVVGRVRRETGDGVDVVLDGIGGAVALRSYRALRPDGRLIMFGHYATLRAGRRNLPRTLGFYTAGTAVLLGSALPRGRRVGFYRIAELRDLHPDWYRDDLARLFDLLTEGRIAPNVADRLPLKDARSAHERIGRGEVTGRLVLLP
ncbi:nitroreductase family deazaflavin-dependent oxidoreductase [Actinomadura sp. K4S16]|uniref:nitroreductase family deazaflavin-dependent oxidoreductase n=1 Tax=Actinomadura sp. K4S16 TaxID=1316147 RepID=UPI0011ED89AF|nr:nitroreductase family deazaflavin-dependent oxidoreductase [Actinomadura sp. K4S16]